jgi:hypothetical protein
MNGSPDSPDPNLVRDVKLLRFVIGLVAVLGLAMLTVAATNGVTHWWGGDVITISAAVTAALALLAFRSVRRIRRLAAARERREPRSPGCS